MTRNRQAVIDAILAEEGGVKDVGDGAGITRYGQTPDWLDRWGLVPPSSTADAAVNYERWFELSGLGDIADSHVFLGRVLADFAIHAGEGTATRKLQVELGVKADGVLGPVTLTAIRAVDDHAIATKVLASRLEYEGVLLASFAIDRRQYAKDWTARIARQLRGLA